MMFIIFRFRPRCIGHIKILHGCQKVLVARGVDAPVLKLFFKTRAQRDERLLVHTPSINQKPPEGYGKRRKILRLYQRKR